MGKLLFFNVPAHGHVNPTLPVVTELVARGHAVVYYNAEPFEPMIAATGAQFQAYPDSSASEAIFAERANNLVDVSVFILEESLRLLPFVLDEIDREQPDRIIFDSLALWGMQAARLRQTPSAASISTLVSEGVPGVLKWRDMLEVLRRSLSRLPKLQRLRQQLVKAYGPGIFPGQGLLPCRGDRNIVYTSREFQPATSYVDDSFTFVGPSILAATRTPAAFPWNRLEAQRKKIYLSLGTIYSDRAEFYRTVFQAFGDYPAQFILATGRLSSQPDWGTVPDNFIVQARVPQLELLPQVDVFITHGGMNSVNEGLNFGVPLVVVPQQIEQAINGRQVARQSAGIILGDQPPYGWAAPGALRSAVTRVLTDPTFRQNAERLSRSFQAAGGYRQAATTLTAG